MVKYFQNVTKSLFKIVFDIPFLYQSLRNIATFVIRIKPIVQALDLKDTDKILDVGCGNGEYSKIVDSKGYYLGIDKDPNFIKRAKDKFKNKNVKFLLADILQINIFDESFDKAILIFVMHHIDDNECELLLRRLGNIVKDRLVIVENVYTKYHILNNILCKLDRGAFIRTLEKQKMFIGKYFSIDKINYYYTKSFIKKRVLFVCKPKYH